MDKKEEEFLQRLQSMFRVEAEEHIRGLTSGLMELEKSTDPEQTAALIETIFREAHSLKGAARSVNMKDVESVCRVLENIFGKLKSDRTYVLTAEQFDSLHGAIDSVSTMVSSVGTNTPKDNKKIMKQLQDIAEVKQPVKATEKKPMAVKKPSEKTENALSRSDVVPAAAELSIEEKPIQIETVRIPTAKLDPLFLQAEQLIQSRMTAEQRTKELKTILDAIESWKKELRKWDVYRSTEGKRQLQELHEFVNEKCNELASRITVVGHAFENDQRSLGHMIDDHVESMKSVLMLPVSTITEGFPKFVRDLARNQGKEVELIVRGKEIEVDKRILEELKDPLIHLIRNCIDHGIKKTGERERFGKPPQGKLTLNFSTTESRHVEIIISDDGEGIELDKVCAAAIKAGLLAKEKVEALSTQEILLFIFQSGITTSPMITDISGRGLGLAIVREKVEKLGGSVTVESRPKSGTTFRLLVPLTLATFKGVIVKTDEHLFAVPTMNIERAMRVHREEIKTVENKETIMIDGKILTAVNLGVVLGLKHGNSAGSMKKNNSAANANVIQLLFLAHADVKIAFIVDEILEEHQILIKELGKQLSRVRNISGATVLGSGKVVPILNVSDLMKSAMRTAVSVQESKEKNIESPREFKILVIDDSITSRTLIKNIVETAGYQVETAVDGVDAYTKALVGEFDLIVSDVDMPRMNGFELTAKIRKDKKLSEIPVVLVTALESRDDREHGIDAGANAYIVKSSFDQSNLLEVIKKLL